jgi:hypothetical protein
MESEMSAWPTPEAVQAAAFKAANYPKLKEYFPAVSMLRESGWSDRKIAKFFKAQGIDVTFSQIYYLRMNVCVPRDFTSFEEYEAWLEKQHALDDEFENGEAPED